MRKLLSFASRNIKELHRHYFTFYSVMLLPCFLIFLTQMIYIFSVYYFDVFYEFKLENIVAEINMIGLCLISILSANLSSKDRKEGLLQRMQTYKNSSIIILFGYIISLLPLMIMQNLTCILMSYSFGLNLNYNYLIIILFNVASEILLVSISLAFGFLFNEKHAGNAMIIFSVIAMLFSGPWIENLAGLPMIDDIASLLPFTNIVYQFENVINGYYDNILLATIIKISYCVIITFMTYFIIKIRRKTID